MLPAHTILFPTDFSGPSLAAFPVACALARDCVARLIVLHVALPPVGNEVLEVRKEPEEYYEGLWAALRALKVPAQNVCVEHQLGEGDPARVIVDVAQDTGAGLIVMSTHGRTGLGRLLMGSVAEQVLRNALCPVLTVKTPLLEIPPAGRKLLDVQSVQAVR
jgi:nucleotide-binding universal stress UspA family protein